MKQTDLNGNPLVKDMKKRPQHPKDTLKLQLEEQPSPKKLKSDPEPTTKTDERKLTRDGSGVLGLTTPESQDPGERRVKSSPVVEG